MLPLGEGHTDEKPPKNPDDFYVFTHRRIEIGYNEDRIVDFTVVASKRAKIVEGEKLSFTVQVKHDSFVINVAGFIIHFHVAFCSTFLQVEFKPSQVEFSKRFEKYLDTAFFQHRVCASFGNQFHDLIESF